jgi:teichuronic acid biosynthesis glycosyltransferase TuaC
MNIAVISTMYPNSQIYQSGIFVHEQVKALLKLGINVKVFAPIPFSPFPLYLFSKKWKKLKNIPKYENIDGVEIIHTRYFALPTGFLKQYWSYPLSYFIKRELKKSGKLASFNIIHAHGSIPDDHSALLLSKSLKLPYIITVHGETVFMKKKDSHLQKSIVAISKADLVVGVSDKVIKLVKLLSGRSKNLIKIYNGFSINEIEIPVKNKTDSEINILFGASLIERKGCEYLIKAFSRLLKRE